MTDRVRWTMRISGAVAALALITPVAADQAIKPDAQGFIVVQPDDVKFADGGQSQVVIAGDPSKPGIYCIRIRFAPGQMSRPHFHDQDRYVTVIKGTWWVALGPEADVFDPSKTKPMKAGSIVKHPAGSHHYDGAKDEEVIVQIIGMGPVKTTQIQAGQ
jgi:quercetin dioxygenase-like cupin family protein